jgi:polysaccharide biosynthesis protein PslG
VSYLVRRRWLLIGFQALVVAGLIASLVINYYHQQYMTRGVSYGHDSNPIPHTDVNPLGVNTFLHEEADPENIERTLDMIADAGFTFVRQIFVWSEIEPAPNTYWSEEHGVSTWDKYDLIVDLAEERGLEIVARLDKPPRWAREGQGHLDEFPDGPPNDIADFAGFVSEVVNRYQGRINYVQLWNEPNLGVEWGGQPIDPAAFAELLAAGYEAAKEADPEIAVLMPGLAPNDQTGPENLSDLLFLEEMYEAGAQDYFDIAAVMVYGYGFSPYDRRVSFERNNFSRPIQTREIMERYGDYDTPIWAVEYGWVSLPDDWDGDASPWGQPVTEVQQAEYLYHGYLRAQREWPWMGAMMIWGFRWASDPQHPDQVGNPTRGFRIVDHDFTPRPAFDLLSRSHPVLDRAYTGSYQADSRLLAYDGWELSEIDEVPVLRPETSNATLSLPFSGTGIDLQFTGGDGELHLTVGGESWDVTAQDLSGGSYAIEGLDDGHHLLEISAGELGDDPLTITGFTVTRETTLSWIYPWLYAAITVTLLLNIASLAGTILSQRPEPHRAFPPVRTAAQLRTGRTSSYSE